MGSSTVMMLFSGVEIFRKDEYNVVDFPLPVGPVTRMIP